jgi:hypothetical protein
MTEPLTMSAEREKVCRGVPAEYTLRADDAGQLSRMLEDSLTELDATRATLAEAEAGGDETLAVLMAAKVREAIAKDDKMAYACWMNAIGQLPAPTPEVPNE